MIFFIVCLLLCTSLSLAQDVDKKALDVKTFSVNLDLPQSERWNEIGAHYKDRSWMLVEYLRANLPKGWLKPLEMLATKLMPIFPDYGDEMVGYSKALGLSEGDIVMVNLVYQLEHLGLSCGVGNTTGPVDPRLCPPGGRPTDMYGNMQVLTEEDDERLAASRSGPGMCTSFVASTPEGDIYHGRNLDWNLPDSLKQFIINVDFQRSGQTVFKATSIVGFVGILHAVKANGFGWSMDARRKGGSILFNALEVMMAKGARTPEQHARLVFESATNYDDAVMQLSTHTLINPAYYIVSGTKTPEGVVLARGREGTEKQWTMQDTIAGQENWYVGITNYDLDHKPPPSDDRQSPMVDNLNALKGQDFDAKSVWSLLETFPTFNPHTDISMVATPKDGSFDVKKWMDHSKI
jgi:hypothetical protein